MITENIEIKYDKKKLITVIALFSFCILGSAAIVYFTSKIDSRPIVKYFIIITDAFAAYLMYVMIKRLVDNKSIITISATSIEVEDGKGPAVFNWKEIKQLSIEKKPTTKSNVYILKVADVSKTRTIDLSQLDKSTEEIREIIGRYRKI